MHQGSVSCPPTWGTTPTPLLSRYGRRDGSRYATSTAETPSWHWRRQRHRAGRRHRRTAEGVGAHADMAAVEAVRPPVMLCGEIPGYSWDDARDAVRNAGYRVAGRADETTVLIICG